MIADRRPRAYARGEQIFQQGDPADGFFCAIEGWAKLYRLSEDGEDEKALIARRLGMKPEIFSRALGKLAPLGVAVAGESVPIQAVARLAAFADGKRVWPRLR